MRQLYQLFIELRPKQWFKNVFIFAAILFSFNFFNTTLLGRTAIVFLLFCMLSSSIYIVNDIVDAEEDRVHPKKKNRPIASGKLSIALAVAAAIVLPLASIALAFYLSTSLGILFIAYYCLFTAYSFYLKKIFLIDVVVIAAGFVLRVLAGAFAIGVAASSWIVTCTFFLALFLGFCKRRNELTILLDNSKKHRPCLNDYTLSFLDQIIPVATSSLVISYAIYTTSSETVAKLGNHNLVYTTPFIVYGTFRYLYLVHNKGKGGSPTEIVYSDLPFIINFVLYLIVIVVIFYVEK